jgi:micrococcal nuclease
MNLYVTVTAFLSFLWSLPVLAYQVIGINDGESLTLMVNQKPLMLRLAGIDAPEKRQAFAQASRNSLHELCFGKDVSYRVQEEDGYGMSIAVVTCNGIEANRTQIERGMAWVYDRHNRDFTLPALQIMARRDRRGLWSETSPVPPWDFRRPQFKKASTAGSPEKTDPAICFFDRRGEYRIVGGIRRYGC